MLGNAVEPQTRPAEMFKLAVDRFSRTIGRVRSGEEREHINNSTPQTPSQPIALDQSCPLIHRLCVVDRSQKLVALVAVGGSVGVHNVLVNSPGDFYFGDEYSLLWGPSVVCAGATELIIG